MPWRGNLPKITQYAGPTRFDRRVVTLDVLNTGDMHKSEITHSIRLSAPLKAIYKRMWRRKVWLRIWLLYVISILSECFDALHLCFLSVEWVFIQTRQWNNQIQNWGEIWRTLSADWKISSPPENDCPNPYEPSSRLPLLCDPIPLRF